MLTELEMFYDEWTMTSVIFISFMQNSKPKVLLFDVFSFFYLWCHVQNLKPLTERHTSILLLNSSIRNKCDFSKNNLLLAAFQALKQTPPLSQKPLPDCSDICWLNTFRAEKEICFYTDGGGEEAERKEESCLDSKTDPSKMELLFHIVLLRKE